MLAHLKNEPSTKRRPVILHDVCEQVSFCEHQRLILKEPKNQYLNSVKILTIAKAKQSWDNKMKAIPTEIN
jgi:hypothetical protein